MGDLNATHPKENNYHTDFQRTLAHLLLLRVQKEHRAPASFANDFEVQRNNPIGWNIDLKGRNAVEKNRRVNALDCRVVLLCVDKGSQIVGQERRVGAVRFGVNVGKAVGAIVVLVVGDYLNGLDSKGRVCHALSQVRDGVCAV